MNHFLKKIVSFSLLYNFNILERGRFKGGVPMFIRGLGRRPGTVPREGAPPPTSPVWLWLLTVSCSKCGSLTYGHLEGRGQGSFALRASWQLAARLFFS